MTEAEKLQVKRREATAMELYVAKLEARHQNIMARQLQVTRTRCLQVLIVATVSGLFHLELTCPRFLSSRCRRRGR